MSTKKNVFTLSKILDKIKSLVLDLDSTKQELQDLNSNCIKGEATLLLETSNVTTSETSFILSDAWDKYKILTVTVEMNFTDTTNIHFFDKIFIIKTIRTDYDYIIYRAIPTGTATGEATLIIKFSDDKETVKLKKVSQSYNAARKVYIYGVS